MSVHLDGTPSPVEWLTRHDAEAHLNRRGGPDPEGPARLAALTDAFLGLDIDEVAVERLMDGQPPATYTTSELEEATRRLSARGWSDSRIADQMRTTDRTVARRRKRWGIERTS